jgi:HK97 family phage major capsid protein
MVSMLDVAETESRPLTDDEKRGYDELQANHQRAVDDIRRRQEILEMRSAAGRNYGSPEGADDGGGRAVPADGVEDVETEAELPFGKFGEQLLAVCAASHTGTLTDPRLGRLSAAATGLSGGVDSEGGHLVQKDFAEGLVQKTHQTGSLLSFTPGVRRIQIGPGKNGLKIRAIDESSRVDGARAGGVQAYWEGEADAVTATKPKFRVLEWTLKKLTAMVYVTEELLQDAVALEQVIRETFAQEFAFKIEDAIINGDGAGKPLGILSSGALVTNAKEGSQVAATIVVENLVKMWARQHSRSKRNSVWIQNGDPFPQLAVMKLGDHGIFLPAGNISGTPFNMLLGRPLLEAEYLPTVGAKGDLLLCDLSEYWMIEKEALQSASSIHVRFVEGEVAFRFVWRLDGMPMWDKPLTPYKGTKTRSPFVVTDVRA